MLEKTRRAIESPLGVSLGALLYAFWVVAVNWTAGHHQAIKSGVVHWIISTVLSITTVFVMQKIYYLEHCSTKRAALLAFIGGFVFDYSVLTLTHIVIGTPRLFLTLVAGVIPTLFFCGSYAALLARTRPLIPPKNGQCDTQNK